MDLRSFFGSERNTARTRDTAARHEAEDIAAIIAAINTQSPAGLKIIASFKNTLNVDVTAARVRGGSSRGTHYDFEVKVDEVWKKVEHKGCKKYSVPKPEDAPWKAGVQFHNGGCGKYSLAKKYAQVWYDMYIQSGSLKEEFGLTSPIPEFEEWFNRDCRAQKDPMTSFGKELKRKVREARGPKSSLLEKRAAVNEALEITEEDKALLCAEVLPVANHALEQKDYWLSIHGNLAGEFHAACYPKFTIASVETVTVEKNLDLEFTFMCSNDFTFNPILRWGKGAGFSCLRLDLK